MTHDSGGWEGDSTIYFSLSNISARGLGKKSLFGTTEPIVRLIVLRDSENITENFGDFSRHEDFTSSRPARNSSNPSWREEFIVKFDSDNCWLFVEIQDAAKIVTGKSLAQSSYGYFSLHVDELRAMDGFGNEEKLLRARKGAKGRVKGTVSICVKQVDIERFSSAHSSLQGHVYTSGGAGPGTDNVSSGNTGLPDVVDVKENLPFGWECRTDQNGRVYYLNHFTRTTQWDKPSEPSTISSHSLGQSLSGSDRQLSAARRHVSEENPLVSGSCSSRDQYESLRPEETSIGNDQVNISGSNTTPDDLSDIPLPPGWDMRVAKNGRVYFIDHVNETTTWVDPRLGLKSRVTTTSNNSSAANAQLVLDMLMSAPHNTNPLPAGWEERATKDGKVFYVDHNTQATSWEDPRLQKAGPSVQFNPNYKSKYKAFKSKLRKAPSSSASCVIKVMRSQLFDTSYDSVTRISKDEPSRFRCKLCIEYVGEAGVDYGGLAREWFQDISRQMFDPYYGLFEYSAFDSYSLQINPHSQLCCGDQHLKYFAFVGRVCGMAVYHGKLIDGYFVKSFYKALLGKEVTLEDLESVDARYYNSMKMLLECDEDELNDIDADFTVTEEYLGQKEVVPLVTHGDMIPVTMDNRHRFVQLVLQYKLVDQVKPQMNAFVSGFAEIVDPSLLKVFDETELELLMAGLPHVNVKDWRDNTKYKRGYSEDHEVIHWFWKAVMSYSDEERCRLLKFVTGTSHVPVNGFSQLHGSNGPQLFTIQMSQESTHKHLPRARTCFNLLELPKYSSYNELKQKLTTAINNSSEFAIL
ncbi:E3 ubiquitin-protein ligase NEDD4-like [Convolutriloba macropyga]|uniref:E3 ubiquitin-protein ligase NEDD4-like n=1 Tax=Convolutriloba macropyga TaxID=536237 RepID=UPI003F52902A